MPKPGTSITTFVDTDMLERKLSEEAKTVTSIRIPFTLNHKKKVGKGEISNPHDWPQRTISRAEVTLSGLYTSGDVLMNINAGSVKRPIQIFPGISQIQTYDGKVVFRVDESNSNNTQLRVTLIYGSLAAPIPSGTTLSLTSYTEHGYDRQKANDGQKYVFQYNYLSNKTLTYQTANLLEQGYLASNKNKDFTLDDKKFVGQKRQLIEIEADFICSPRIGGAFKNNRLNNITAEDGGTRMGGWQFYIRQDGGLVTDRGGRPPNLGQLLAELKYLEDEGTFDSEMTVSDRDQSTPLVNMYCNRDTKFSWYRLMLNAAGSYRLTEGTKFGYSADLLHVGGIDIKINTTSGMGKGMYILEGNQANQECLFIRENQETSNNKGVTGDNIAREDATTLTFRSRLGWQNVISENQGDLV